MRSPVARCTIGSSPCARSCAHKGSVRRSCQTMALCTGRPVRRFHSSGGLALVGDADGADVGGLQPGLGDRLARGRQLRAPDLQRVVLDPAGLWEDLPELALRHRDDAAHLVEDDAARTGGALVEREDVAHAGLRAAWGRPLHAAQSNPQPPGAAAVTDPGRQGGLRNAPPRRRACLARRGGAGGGRRGAQDTAAGDARRSCAGPFDPIAYDPDETSLERACGPEPSSRWPPA